MGKRGGNRRRLFNNEQSSFLLENYPNMTNDELKVAFEREFPDREYDRRKIIAWAKRQGIRLTEETLKRSRAEVGAKNKKYTDEMLDFLREYVPGHIVPEIQAEYERRFGVRPTATQISNLKMKLGLKSGVRYGMFEKGHVPANKGKTWDEFMPKESQERVRSAGNMFGRGHRPHNRVHELLDTRVGTDGIKQIYVRPRNATCSARNWIAYSQYVWMQHKGREFPADCKCVHCDHDNTNFDPDNLMAVPNSVYGIVIGNFNGNALEYWDRDSLRTAVQHAKMVSTRHNIEKRMPKTCTRCGKRFRVPKSKQHYAQQIKLCPECHDEKFGKRGDAQDEIKPGRKESTWETTT